MQTELLKSVEKPEDVPATILGVTGHDKGKIGFNNCSFSWESLEGIEGSTRNTRKAFRLRIDGEVIFQSGKINLIVGPTASGKVNYLPLPLPFLRSD